MKEGGDRPTSVGGMMYVGRRGSVERKGEEKVHVSIWANRHQLKCLSS